MTLNIASLCAVLAACVTSIVAYDPYMTYFNQDPRMLSTGFDQQHQLVGLPAAYLAAQQQQQLFRPQMLGQQGYGGFDPSIGWQQQQQQQLLRQHFLQQQYNPYHAQLQRYGGGYGNGYNMGEYGSFGNYGADNFYPGQFRNGFFVTRDSLKPNTNQKA